MSFAIILPDELLALVDSIAECGDVSPVQAIDDAIRHYHATLLAEPENGLQGDSCDGVLQCR